MIQLQKPDEEQILAFAVGEQIRLNHEDCAAGKDARERLYIKRVDGGYVCHCFNCGDSGWHFEKEIRRLPVYPSRYDYTLDAPAAMVTTNVTKAIPLEYRVWLYKHFVTDDLIERWKIGWDLKTGRLYVPYKWGFQLRSLKEAPKWLTCVDSTKRTWCHYQNHRTTGIVFVEDMISYLRVVETATVDAVALLGVNYNKILKVPAWIGHLNQKDCLIWFDNDIAGQEAALEFKKELAPIAKSVTIVRAPEPKILSPDVLEDILKISIK